MVLRKLPVSNTFQQQMGIVFAEPIKSFFFWKTTLKWKKFKTLYQYGSKLKMAFHHHLTNKLCNSLTLAWMASLSGVSCSSVVSTASWENIKSWSLIPNISTRKSEQQRNQCFTFPNAATEYSLFSH